MSRSPERFRFDAIAARVGEILYYIWDPIGVSGLPQARDEYDSYVPVIVKMLISKKGKDDIALHLYQIEKDFMGLSVGSIPSNHHEEVASILIDNFMYLDPRKPEACQNLAGG